MLLLSDCCFYQVFFHRSQKCKRDQHTAPKCPAQIWGPQRRSHLHSSYKNRLHPLSSYSQNVPGLKYAVPIGWKVVGIWLSSTGSHYSLIEMGCFACSFCPRAVWNSPFLLCFSNLLDYILICRLASWRFTLYLHFGWNHFTVNLFIPFQAYYHYVIKLKGPHLV